MPTPIDRALQSKSAVLGFAGLVTAAAAWSIWGSDMFPASGQQNPQGPSAQGHKRQQKSKSNGDVQSWSLQELKEWLDQRGLLPAGEVNKDELMRLVKNELGQS